MPSERSNELKLAVLIDADNIPYSNVKGMMEEIAKYGTPTFKRIYGDWTKPTTTGWKGVLLQNAITPIQQYSYTSGKNATDSAMIIDAMDILYTGRVDGFCIVSSDSDFTRLATRLREAGMKVIGIGEKKTPEPFITACDKFIYLEILSTEDVTPDIRARRHKKDSLQKLDKRVLTLITTSINDVADEGGWAFLGEVGTLILKKQPNFDARNYGFRKLLQLMKSIDDIEVDERLSESGGTRHVYVRVKSLPA
ncbi:MAG TPA: NYN domain-containing protein [Chryseosolibacter sp.]|nr:NYN domain-containing protein [Chryseosolibacter sp.]